MEPIELEWPRLRGSRCAGAAAGEEDSSWIPSRVSQAGCDEVHDDRWAVERAGRSPRAAMGYSVLLVNY